MRAAFREDATRFDQLSLRCGNLLLDYSKNRVTADTMQHLMQLARESELEAMRDAMCRGERINFTENRAVLHTALRAPVRPPLVVEGVDVEREVAAVLNRMQRFVESIHNGSWLGHTGKPIRNVVNIGIGGSDLGPAMVCHALDHYAVESVRVHFVSNLDPAHLASTLAHLDPETTLFIVASKTFTTLETLANANSAKAWLLAALRAPAAVARHFVALSTNTQAVEAFGIDPENMFIFWDWVGGRYSLWSAIGLSIALQIGWGNFQALLAGAHAMDIHFKEAPLEANMPALPAAARHGVERQERQPRQQAGQLQHRPHRVGRARHQRPARVLRTGAPGHAPDSDGFSGGGGQPHPPGRPARMAARQLPGTDRGTPEGQVARGDRGGTHRPGHEPR
jgi:glucose-6-phosphate isomerase